MSNKEYYDVDYDSVKAKLKIYLANTTTLKDYDFEGSAISMWLHFIAYVVVYLNSILNFVSNEMFIRTAKLEENVLKSAYQLNYLPKRKQAPSITLTVVNSHSSPVSIPAETEFVMGEITLTTVEDYTIPASSSLDIIAYEGEWVTVNHTYEGADFETIRLSDKEEVDWNYFDVYVNGVAWTSVYENKNYDGANNYFIRYLDNFEVRFDKALDSLGEPTGLFSAPEVNDVITVKYLKTNGATYNGTAYSQAISIDEITGHTYLSISTTDTLSGGIDEESMSSVSTYAPLFYSAAGRAVNESDYNQFIRLSTPFSNYTDMVVYSGHRDWVDFDEIPSHELSTVSKKNVGFYVYSGVKRTVNADLEATYEFMSITDMIAVEAYFDDYRFMQTFPNYKKTNILVIKPIIDVYLFTGFDINKESFEQDIYDFIDEKVGYNQEINKSELISFIQSYGYVKYCDISFTTSFQYTRPLNYITLNNVTGLAVNQTVSIGSANGKIVEVKPNKNQIVVERTSTTVFPSSGTLTTVPGSKTISSNFNDVVVRIFNKIVSTVDGTIMDYDDGYILIGDSAAFDTYETISVDFVLDDDVIIEAKRELFLDHEKAEVNYH